MSAGNDPFFIGWAGKAPKGQGPFLAIVSAALIGAFALIAFAIAATQNDPGDGAFRWDMGRQSFVGVIENEPYPVLHVFPNNVYPDGHTLMLSGPGKRGVRERSEPLEGKVVKARGVLLKRGSIDMLQVGGGRNLAISDAERRLDPPEAEPLGRWRLTGEICDGKCNAGAMRPGRGLAHKACANLCLVGGVPPVFVSTGPVEGESFFMIAGPDGGDVTGAILDLTGMLVEVEGDVERRGDILVFRIAPETLRPL